MTQVFDKEGKVHPVTLINTGPVVVTQLKTKEKDGYSAIQVGFGQKRKVNKAEAGHMKGEKFCFLREFRLEDDPEGINVGDKIDLSSFEAGDKVNISGISKGKGFQGVVKRHNFAGGPKSHGQKHSERKPGSIGAGGVQRVFKGLRMAGRMGGDRVTVKNLEVVLVDGDKNQILVRGALPGRRGTLLEIKGK